MNPRPIVRPDFPLYWQLLLLNVGLTTVSASLMYLWHWAIGWLFVVFVLTTMAIVFTLNRLVDRFIGEVVGDRDSIARAYNRERIEWEEKVFEVTNKAVGKNYITLPELDDEGNQITSEQVYCEVCGSRHPALAYNFFHPTLHLRLPDGKPCNVPVLRSLVERIELDLPGEEVYTLSSSQPEIP